jgi:lipopolysaccharide export system protein LptA
MIKTLYSQFPLTVKVSNYTEVRAENQADYNAILNACSSAEASGQDAIFDSKFPITILTYNFKLQQTGSVVIKSEKIYIRICQYK